MSVATLTRPERSMTETPDRPAALLPDPNKRIVLVERCLHRPERIARHAAYAAGWDWGLPEGTIDDLVSVVDALVSNSICHAKWTDDWPVVHVTIERVGRRIVVEVRDPDPALPIWPTARPMDIAALLDDKTVKPDDPILIHRQGLVDVAGRAELSAFAESVGKCVRAVIEGGR